MYVCVLSTFILQMFSALLFRILWIFLLTTDGGLGHENMAWQFFLLLRFTLLFICVIWWLRRRQHLPWSQQFTALPGFTSWVASRLLLIIRWWRVLLPVRSVYWPIKQPRRSLSRAVSQLEQLVASNTDSMASLYNISSVVICLLAFAAFLRFDELAKLVRSDVKIENEMLKLFIQSSKTDQ